MSEVLSYPAIQKMISQIRDESSFSDNEMVLAIAGLIYLRWADFFEAEQEAIAVFEDDHYMPVLPTSLHWRSWHLIPANELKSFFSDRLLPTLKQLNNSRNISLATYLHRIAPAVQNLSQLPHQALDALIHWMADQPFETPRDRRALLDIFDEILKNLHDKYSGEYRTPSAIAQLIVALASPVAEDRIYDPCFGSAGFLTAACDYIKQQETENFTRSGFPPIGLSGVEINLEAYIIGLVRLTLAGIDQPQLELGDSLERAPADDPNRNGFDIVLANPPWGWKTQYLKQNRLGLKHFAFITNEGSGLFVQHALQQLKPDGRAVIVVPEGFLFRRGADQKLRQFLIENHRVETVVSLPENAFLPYSAVKANILILRRGGSTKSIRMLDAKPFFEKSKNGNQTSINQTMIDGLVQQIRDVKLGEDSWDIDSDTLAKIDWDFTPKRRDQTVLTGIFETLKADIKIVPLKKCCRIFSGRSIQSREIVDTPPLHKTKTEQQSLFPDEKKTAQRSLFDELVIPFVRIKDIQQGQVSKGSSWLSQSAASTVDAKWKLRSGDVLLSKSGTIGKIGIVRNGAVGAIATNGLYVLRPDLDRLDPHFLTAYLSSNECRIWMENNARGATIRHLNRRIIDEMPVPLPPLQIQHRVAEQYRKHGVDALTFLTQLLTESEKDPIAEWIEQALRHLKPEWHSVDFKDADIQGMMHGACLGGAFTGVWHWVRENKEKNPLSSWILSLMDVVTSLQHCDEIPPGPALYSLLQQAETSLKKSESKIKGHLPNEEKARILTRIIRDRVNGRMTEQIKGVHVVISSETIRLKSDSANNIDIAFTNKGDLPLRDVHLSTIPDWGHLQIGYLHERTIKMLTFSGITPKGESQFSLMVNWTGITLDGQRINGKTGLSFELGVTEEGDERKEISGSPYVCGDPVGPDRKDVFFGREQLLEQIRRQISTSGNVVLIEGNRRSGKSSILKHLEGTTPVPGWIGVYSSLQGTEGARNGVGVPTEEIFREMANSIAKGIMALGIDTPLPDGTILPPGKKLGISKACRQGITVESPFSDFRDYLEITLDTLAKEDLGLFLMLDEFEKIQEGINSGVTSSQVPENIRFMVQTYPRFSAVITGSRRLKRLREEYWSVLYGLGTRFGVSSLPEEPARRLITEPVKGFLTYSGEAINRIIYLAAGQPFLLQSLCNRIFDMAAQLKIHSIVLDIVEQASRELVEDNEHFASLWDDVLTDRRRFILCLIHKEEGGPDPLRMGIIQERFIRYGLEVDEETLINDLEFLRELELVDFSTETGNSNYALSIPLMGIWIERQKDFSAILKKARSETEDA